MRIGNYEGRLVIVIGELAHDVEKNSSGVGLGRDPQRWLVDGDVLTSYIEGIGEMRHRFVAASPVRKEI
jgi:hypothetical protein